MDLIVSQLNKARNVLLATHMNPDGDAVGSLLAMGKALETLGKQVTMYSESPIPAVYRFLPSVERIVHRLEAADGFDTAVVLDCGNLGRTGKAQKTIASTARVVNLDHHETNSGFGSLRLVDPNACATAEIVYRLIKKMQVPIDRTVASALYTGIFTDTGSFRFSNTNRAAFAICHEMVASGVDPYTVAQHVYGTYSLGRIKLLNLALDSIEISNNGKLSMMTLSRDMLMKTGTRPEDIDGLINYAKRIEDVKIAALIQERRAAERQAADSEFHVSLRSDGEVNVATIAEAFGGGGHPTASGFNVRSTLEDLKAQIIDLAEGL